MRFAFFHQVQALSGSREKSVPEQEKEEKKEIILQYTGGKGKKKKKNQKRLMTRERQGGIKDQVGGRTSAKEGGGGGQQTAQTAGVGDTGARSYQKKKGVGVCPHLFVVNSKQKATSEEQ